MTIRRHAGSSEAPRGRGPGGSQWEPGAASGSVGLRVGVPPLGPLNTFFSHRMSVSIWSSTRRAGASVGAATA